MIIRCYQCGHFWATRTNNLPKKCWLCGKDWRKPSFFTRLRLAVRAFKCEPYGEPKHREKVP